MDYDPKPFEVVDALVWIINNPAIAADKLRAAAILSDVDPADLMPIIPIISSMAEGYRNATVTVEVIPRPVEVTTSSPVSIPQDIRPPFTAQKLVRAKRDETGIIHNGGKGKQRVKFAIGELRKLSDEALATYYHTLGNKDGDVIQYGTNKGALRPNVVRAIENSEKELRRRKRKDLLIAHPIIP